MTDPHGSHEGRWKTQIWYASNRQTGGNLLERTNRALKEIADLGGEVVDVQHTYTASATTSRGMMGNLIFVMVVYHLPIDVVYLPPTEASPPDMLLGEAG